MSKSRIQSIESKATRPSSLGERLRFFGLSLAGGKTDKACLAVVDYYPQQKKLFLSHLFEKIKNDEHISGDQKILELISQHQAGAVSIAFDVPWRLPTSLRPETNLDLAQPHLEWAAEKIKKLNLKKNPKKNFQPYTQRCVEIYLATELEEKFILNHAMGANAAPLLARAMYLQRRINLPALEVMTKVSMWRIGKSLKLMKSQLRSHRDPTRGEEVRKLALQKMNEQGIIFIYEQDRKGMIENAHAFEAFLCALTGLLRHKDLTQKKPQDFPKDEDWIEVPAEEISWRF
jgi:hypothetical protein